MQLFACPSCGGTLYFDNLACTNCGAALVFDPDGFAMRLPDQAAPCANREAIGCNWRADPSASPAGGPNADPTGAPPQDPTGPAPRDNGAAAPGDHDAHAAGSLCRACALTRVRPDLSVDENRRLWTLAEADKRRVLAGLERLGWFGADDPGPAPVFHLLAERTAAGADAPVMGHADGRITLNIAESDPAEIAFRRERLNEPFRTMVGHVRHEIGHFLYVRLGVDPAVAPQIDRAFGPETRDYAQALRVHYEQGPPADWRDRHVTAYASCHRDEDWAETAAHALHLLDLLDSARAAGLAPEPHGPPAQDPAGTVAAGLTLGLALNHANRALGLADAYPFVVSPIVRDKLETALRLIAQGPPRPV
ncbi:MAG: putative zinc-binding metallopeptidase [Pseudomonadota bacterium]